MIPVLMNGAAIIALGLIAFGTLHTHNADFMPWQWLVIIFGILTFITAILFWSVSLLECTFSGINTRVF